SIIFGAKASGNEFVGSLANNSTIAYATFKGEKFASSAQGAAQIVDCYYDATNSTDLGASLINLTSCVENTVLYAPGAYSIVDKSSATELNNITSWEFGQDVYGWAYVKGEVEDIPTLINAEDRAEYKEIVTIENKNGQEKYGKINGFMRYELRTLPVGTDTTLYSPFDDGSNANLFVGANGAIYELLGGVSGGNTVSNVNDIITSGLSLATKSYLDTKTLNWEVKAIGEDDYAPFTDSNFDPVAHPSSVFHLKFNDSVAYLEAYLTIKDSKVALEYAYVNKGITLNNFVRNLDLISYYNGRLADAGLDYDDITIKLLDKDGSEITLTDGFIPVSLDYFDGASYTLKITTPSTQNYASSTQTHTISLLEGEMDYSGFDISSKIGGENEENAVIFDENGITPAPNNFSLLGYDFATLTLQEIVSRIDHEGYLIVGLDGIKDAGEYTLKLNATQEYFVDKEIEVKFYVSPKEIEVYAKYDGLEEITIEYYDTLDASKVSYHLADGSEITTLVGARYTTDYAVGNNITTGGNYYSLSFLAPLNEYDNPNYIVSESVKVVKIFVEPKSVYLDSDGFVSENLTFDGKAHAIIVDESKIVKGDAPIFEYKLEYA
ncbi:MAG: hypothetical protein J6V69_05350, partial [Clostridia bacterium]|nr:hypothetical protein [Clostridia bacterium]